MVWNALRVSSTASTQLRSTVLIIFRLENWISVSARATQSMKYS